MSDQLQFEGEFWLPGEKSKVAGILRLEPSGGVHVDLIGYLGSPNLRTPERHLVVYGDLVRQPPEAPGGLVTLLGAFPSRMRMGAGPSAQRMVANTLLVGDFLVEGAEQQFSKANLSFQHLDAWMPQTGIELEWKDSVTLATMTRPEEQSVPVNGGVLTFGLAQTTQSSQEGLTLRESIAVQLRPAVESSPDEIRKRLLRPLIHFLGLATGRPNYVASLVFVRDVDDGPWPDRVWQYTGAPRDTSPPLPTDFLLPYDRAALPSQLARFFDVYHRYAGLLDLLFGLESEPPKYVEMQYALYVDALNLFDDLAGRMCRLETDSPASLAILPEAPRNWLEGLAATRSSLWIAPTNWKRLHHDLSRIRVLIRLLLMHELGLDLAPAGETREFHRLIELNDNR